jgi:5-methylcytosine-specific restriction protein A
LAVVSQTERETLVRARIGQGQFRESLFEYWGGCAITGVNRPDLLRASHIKPWRSSDNVERLSRFNGLLLIPQYDHLFDRGYITFDAAGRVEVSPAIASLPPGRIGVATNATLRSISREHRDFLSYHRSEVFLKRLAKD